MGIIPPPQRQNIKQNTDSIFLSIKVTHTCCGGKQKVQVWYDWNL